MRTCPSNGGETTSSLSDEQCAEEPSCLTWLHGSAWQIIACVSTTTPRTRLSDFDAPNITVTFLTQQLRLPRQQYFPVKSRLGTERDFHIMSHRTEAKIRLRGGPLYCPTDPGHISSAYDSHTYTDRKTITNNRQSPLKLIARQPSTFVSPPPSPACLASQTLSSIKATGLGVRNIPCIDAQQLKSIDWTSGDIFGNLQPSPQSRDATVRGEIKIDCSPESDWNRNNGPDAQSDVGVEECSSILGENDVSTRDAAESLTSHGPESYGAVAGQCDWYALC